MTKPDQAMDRTPEEPSSAPPTPETSATTSATTKDVPAFGWSAYAERINVRFAMIGF